MLLFKKIHEITGLRFYLYCGYVADGYEYTCIFSGYVNEEYLIDAPFYFDYGFKISRNFYNWIKK